MRGSHTILRLLATLFVLFCTAGRADAFFFADNGGPQAPGAGLALGPDGNFWVAEASANSVAQITPAGTVLHRYDVGTDPGAVANGPGGRVWVAVGGPRKLVWFDAAAPTPEMHDVPLGSSCAPVGLTAGGDGDMYFSLPSDGVCNAGRSAIGEISDDGTGTATIKEAGGGFVQDLEAAGGKLFAPDLVGGVVRRIEFGTLNVETQVTIPTPGARPSAITSDGAGNLWVVESQTGKVATFGSTQDAGNATEFTPTGGAVVSPSGIVAGADGRMYVTGTGSANVMRMTADGSAYAFYELTDAESQPFDIVRGADGDVWFTDHAKTRIVRLVSDVPRTSTGRAKASGPTSAIVHAQVNPRGNASDVVLEYGTTTKYGATTGAKTAPNGVDPTDVTRGLTHLKPETVYHVRARATNAEGVTYGKDATFKTPPFPVLETSTTYHFTLYDDGVVLRDISIDRLRGTETAVISCSGARCPFATRRITLPRGNVVLKPKPFAGRHLPPGTKLSVRVFAPHTIGSYKSALVGKGGRTAFKVGCLRPPGKRPSRCP